MPKWRKWVAQEISGFWEMCILVVEENWIFLALSLSVDLCLPCAQSLLLGNKTFLTWGWHSHPRARQVAAGKAEQLAGYGHMGVVRSVVHSKNTLEWRRQLPLSRRRPGMWLPVASLRHFQGTCMSGFLCVIFCYLNVGSVRTKTKNNHSVWVEWKISVAASLLSQLSMPPTSMATSLWQLASWEILGLWMW